MEVGAARTRGLGQVRLTDVTRTRVDLADRDQVLAWLCGRPCPAPAPAADGGLPGDGRLGIEISWAAVTPVMVRASTVNEAEPDRDRAVDTVPLRPATRTGRRHPAAAARVLGQGRAPLPRRTDRPHRRGTGDLPDAGSIRSTTRGSGPVTALFGTAGGHRCRARTTTAATAERPGLARGAVGARLPGAAAAERVVTHVAVDRWTGGAAENLLFSVQEPASAELAADPDEPGRRRGPAARTTRTAARRWPCSCWCSATWPTAGWRWASAAPAGRGSVRVSRVGVHRRRADRALGRAARAHAGRGDRRPARRGTPRVRGLAEGGDGMTAPAAAPRGTPSRPGDRRRCAGLVRRRPACRRGRDRLPARP